METKKTNKKAEKGLLLFLGRKFEISKARQFGKTRKTRSGHFGKTQKLVTKSKKGNSDNQKEKDKRSSHQIGQKF